MFLYLNDVEEGGETRLNALNIDVKPKKGMALIWPSVRNDDTTALEDWAWHEAQPVKKGQKFGANAWLRSELKAGWMDIDFYQMSLLRPCFLSGSHQFILFLFSVSFICSAKLQRLGGGLLICSAFVS